MMLFASKFIKRLKQLLELDIENWMLSNETNFGDNYKILTNVKSKTEISYNKKSYEENIYLKQNDTKIILSDIQTSYLKEIFINTMQLKTINSIETASTHPIIQENLALKKEINKLKRSKFKFIAEQK